MILVLGEMAASNWAGVILKFWATPLGISTAVASHNSIIAW